jgi:hypothetical protein
MVNFVSSFDYNHNIRYCRYCHIVNYLIQNFVKELGQVEPDSGEVRPEAENPEEPGLGDESELIQDDNEFDEDEGIDDDGSMNIALGWQPHYDSLSFLLDSTRGN